MTTLNQDQLNQVEVLYKHYKKTDLSRSEINALVKKGTIKNPSWLKQDQYKVSRGVYSLPVDGDISPKIKEDIISELPKEETAPAVDTVNQAAFVISSLTGNIIPTKDPVFVPWGYFKDIKSIVNYAKIVKLIKKLVRNKHYNFLETLAEDVFDELFKDRRIDKITLQIEKLEIMKDCSSVGIQISKKRSHDKL